MSRILKLSFLSVVFLVVSCKSYYLVNKSESSNVELNGNSAKGSEEIELEVKPYRDALSASMNEVLNNSDVEMMTGIPEGSLGNFSSDLTLEVGNKYYKKGYGKIADFVLLNNGGLRTSLPKGEITRKKIFELMPFENELVVITLSREKTVELFNFRR